MAEDFQETVVLKINQARNLPKTDLIGSIDAYFVFKYGGVEHKTQVVKNTKTPVFNEIVNWNFDSSAEEITFELWDFDSVTKNDLVATGKFTVADFKNKKKRKYFPLTTAKGKSAGEVELEVVYNAYVPPAERSFDLAPSGFQQSILDYLKTKPDIEQVINFVYTSVIWENLLTYGILAAILILNYFLIVTTEWRTLVYLFLLSAELYVIQFVFKKWTKFLDQPNETVEQNTNTVVNYIFGCTHCECKNPLEGVKPLENFQKTPYYGPTVIIVALLLSALITGIFSGSFLGFVAVFGLLLAPGIHTKGYDAKFVEWWTPNVYTPIIKPQWDKNVKPYVDKYVYGIEPEPAIPSEVPASS